ncbi:hypothetical protein Glove_40g142 [Diversispora epigaea]|uniref:Uncharacterized protein n=1 Tax=Diversispora epigaea TaxID=1348612 RepID=A0A397JRH8_9GLOM|nr:hypothetical protein Glove_40g142 [Diversispora epigaea]
MYKMYTQEPEYNKETITSGELLKLAKHLRKPKIYNPKTNRTIAIDRPTYNKLIRDGYVHWEEEGLLIPPSPFENYISGASTRIGRLPTSGYINHDPFNF